jgi:Tfp pilus assembly protein PilN
MRPINLIPTEERRAHGGAARTGPVAYILVGALAVLLIGVVMLVLTSNQISDREGEVEKLQAQSASVTAKTARLSPYVSFQQVARQRIETVSRLANDRFDWDRVIRQISLVLPGSILLHEMHASGGGSGEGTTAVTAPSMLMVGCSPSQDKVAALVASLKQIDGVTRVGLAHSTEEKDEEEGEESDEPTCAGEFEFELTIAFDAAPISPDGAGAVAVTAEPEAAPEEGSSEGESEESSSEGEESSETESSSTEGTASTATGTEGSG